MKYLLTFTYPNGKQVAAGMIDGQFELVPIDGKNVENALYWNEVKGVEDFFKQLKKQMGEKWSENIVKLRPRVAMCEPEEVIGMIRKPKKIQN